MVNWPKFLKKHRSTLDGAASMDVRRAFLASSDQLIAEFNKTASARHPGGKGTLREDAIAKFLVDYLPTRYGIGRGEVISTQNRGSGQLDIVIYDPLKCPRLHPSESHAIFPIESVYGAISVKSTLDSRELEDAYANIASVKQLVPQSGFVFASSPGSIVGVGTAVPVTAVVAYHANRSLEAIQKQVHALDSTLQNISLRPDWVVIIGEGIIGPREQLRREFNKYTLPEEKERLGALRKSKRHTLLSFYMQMLDELNSLTLRPLHLRDYVDMPTMVGGHRVKGHDRMAQYPLGKLQSATPVRITESGIRKILNGAKSLTYRQHLEHCLGEVPSGLEQITDLNALVYEWNPKGLLPVSKVGIKTVNGEVVSEGFVPIRLEIDGSAYFVDSSALAGADFEDNPDFTLDELMSG